MLSSVVNYLNIKALHFYQICVRSQALELSKALFIYAMVQCWDHRVRAISLKRSCLISQEERIKTLLRGRHFFSRAPSKEIIYSRRPMILTNRRRRLYFVIFGQINITQYMAIPLPRFLMRKVRGVSIFVSIKIALTSYMEILRQRQVLRCVN